MRFPSPPRVLFSPNRFYVESRIRILVKERTNLVFFLKVRTNLVRIVAILLFICTTNEMTFFRFGY
jgi:hypothetical protein